MYAFRKLPSWEMRCLFACLLASFLAVSICHLQSWVSSLFFRCCSKETFLKCFKRQWSRKRVQRRSKILMNSRKWPLASARALSPSAVVLLEHRSFYRKLFCDAHFFVPAPSYGAIYFRTTGSPLLLPFFCFPLIPFNFCKFVTFVLLVLPFFCLLLSCSLSVSPKW